MVEKLKTQLLELWEKIQQQPAYQQLKSSWEELDPLLRFRIQLGAGALSALALIVFTISSLWSVRSIRHDLKERDALTQQLQSAAEELSRLRSERPGGSGNMDQDDGAWPVYFQALAARAEVDKAQLNVSAEKKGADALGLKEFLYDLSLKKSNLRQVIRLAFELENGARPVKVRNLLVDTKQDPEGYMDATFSISAFQIAKQE